MSTDKKPSFELSELLEPKDPPTLESIGQLSAAELGEGAAEGEFARLGPMAEIVGVRDVASARPTQPAMRAMRWFLVAVILAPILVAVVVLVRAAIMLY